MIVSQADFSAEPLYSWINGLSGEVKTAIKQSKIMFCNGYGFDELSPSLIMSAVEYAAEVGTAVFFDPGPKGKSLSTGTPDEQRALNLLLRMSDVLLLTSDEVSFYISLSLHDIISICSAVFAYCLGIFIFTSLRNLIMKVMRRILMILELKGFMICRTNIKYLLCRFNHLRE